MKSFALLLLLFWTGHIAAQTRQITLNGTIAVSTGEVFPYKVVLTEVDGKVKGYSFTYKEPNETKAVIKGTLDKHMRTLTFSETDIVYSHGYQTRAFMCLVDADLQSVSDRQGNRLTGSITSRETDKTSCTPGTLLFSNEDEIRNLFSYHDNYDTVISMGKRPKEVTKPAIPETIAPAALPPTEKVTAGIEKTYDWSSDSVIIDIWDGGNIDGDRISVAFNGKACLTNYFLVKEKKQLRLPLSPQTINTISIYADNEGSDPPNTASLLLTDCKKQYSVLAYKPKGQQAIIKIRRAR